MPKPIRFYVQFGVAIFVGNLIVNVIDESGLNFKSVVKATLAGLIAASILAWFDQRKLRRANQTRDT